MRSHGRKEDGLDFEWFFRAEQPMVYRSIYLMLHDKEAARDVVQEAFIRLYENWAKVSRYERPDAWVRRVAVRIAVRWIRRKQFLESLPLPLEKAPDPEPDPDIIGAVKQLSPRLRAVVALFYFEDRPISEIADILECSEASAKVRLHRARVRLKELLGQEADDVVR